MATTNIMRGGTHTQNMKDCHAPRFGWVSLNNSPFHSMQSTFSSPSQQLLGILLFLLPFIRNLPSIRHPNSCIIVWKPLICWLVFLPSLSLLPTGCPWFTSTEVLSIRKGRNRHTNLCIMRGVFVDDDAIRMDRHLAMLLELRCKEIVTLRRTYLILAIVWIVCLLARLRSQSSWCSNIRLCTTRCTESNAILWFFFAQSDFRISSKSWEWQMS